MIFLKINLKKNRIMDIDKDGSGTIDFDEFLDMMKKKMVQF